MAEGWKQVWDDVRNALRGEVKAEAKPAPEGDLAREANPESVPQGASRAAPEPGDALAGPREVTPDGLPTERMAVSADGSPSLGTEAAALALPEQETVPLGAEAPLEPQQPPSWRLRLKTGLTVLAVGGVLASGLWLSGGADLWSRWTAPQPPAPDVVATFDGGQITTADLEAHLQLLVPEEYRAAVRSSEGLRLLVQEMVTDELARRWAAEQKVDADETFRHTMEHITEEINLGSLDTRLHAGGIPVPESEIQAYYEANKTRFGDQPLNAVREQILQTLTSQKEDQYLRDYIERLKSNASITRNFELLDVPAPSEVDLRAYYAANTERYTVTARFTVDMLTIPVERDETAARGIADKALLKLRSGADFATISAEVPEAQVITNTVVAGGTWGAEWDAAVSALQPGELSDVLRAADAFSVVRLIQAQPARPQTFDEARPQALAVLQQQRTKEWMKANGSKTLFTLKSKQYTLGQFYDEYQELGPIVQAQFAGPEGMKQLAELLIDRLVLIEDTYDQLLQVKNKDLIDQTRLDVLKQMLHQQEVDDKIQVTDEEMQAYYEQNRDLMQLPPKARIRYIRIGLGETKDEQNAARARADEAYKKLVPGLFKQGADLATVAREYSEDPETAANGGELPGWIGETDNPFEPPELHALHEVVFALPVNEISPPFEVGDSLYIVQVVERTEPQTLSFEEAKPYIQDLLSDQKHDDLLRGLQERLVKQVNLVIYDRVLQTYSAQFARTEADDANQAGGS